MAKVKKSIVKPKSMTQELIQLHACIESDQVKINKLYEKMIAINEKSVMAVVKKLDKAKQVSAKAKAPQEKKVTKSGVSEVNAFQKELDLLKVEKSKLENGYRKFTASLKAAKEFEKAWAKKVSAKPKSKVKKKTVKLTESVEQSETPQVDIM
jgi:hypothetical protein